MKTMPKLLHQINRILGKEVQIRNGMLVISNRYSILYTQNNPSFYSTALENLQLKPRITGVHLGLFWAASCIQPSLLTRLIISITSGPTKCNITQSKQVGANLMPQFILIKTVQRRLIMFYNICLGLSRD